MRRNAQRLDALFGVDASHDNTWPRSRRRLWSFVTSTACTVDDPAIACAAATPADSPSTQNTGSIRAEAYAMYEAEKQTGTIRFEHSPSLGTIAR